MIGVLLLGTALPVSDLSASVFGCYRRDLTESFCKQGDISRYACYGVLAIVIRAVPHGMRWHTFRAAVTRGTPHMPLFYTCQLFFKVKPL